MRWFRVSWFFVVGLCGWFWVGLCGGGEIDLERRVGLGVAPVPVELVGFSGEVLGVLVFDLEVMGCEVVGVGEGQFVLDGGLGVGGLRGRLVDRLGGGEVLFSRLYSSGSVRDRGHALANDVVGRVFGEVGVGGSRIAFKGRVGGGFPEIYVSGFDGFGVQAVTGDGCNVAAPAWVPGELRLFYTSYKLRNPDIFSHDLRSGERVVVSGYSGLNTSAAVSVDGERLAMILSKDGSPDLYVSDLDGGGLRRLTRTREEEACPCWSPDGGLICFTSAVGGGARLYLIGSDGGSMRRLRAVGASGVFSEPDWSPDGRWIAFTALMGREFHVCVVGSEGGEAVVLARGEDASWAPNSRNLVFMRKVGGRKVLSILDVFTKRVKDVPGFVGESSQPAWGR